MLTRQQVWRWWCSFSETSDSVWITRHHIQKEIPFSHCSLNLSSSTVTWVRVSKLISLCVHMRGLAKRTRNAQYTVFLIYQPIREEFNFIHPCSCTCFLKLYVFIFEGNTIRDFSVFPAISVLRGSPYHWGTFIELRKLWVYIDKPKSKLYYDRRSVG
jgi:hypothetical protein